MLWILHTWLLNEANIGSSFVKKKKPYYTLNLVMLYFIKFLVTLVRRRQKSIFKINVVCSVTDEFKIEIETRIWLTANII